MTNLREKYGEWGVVLGATEGVGEAFCKKLAEGGMNLVMVGRREELLKEKGEKFHEEYGVDYKVVRADLSCPDEACEAVFSATEGLDMGFMSYVACLHHFGKFQHTSLELTEAVACECEKTGVDVEVCTLGTTLTPTAIKTFPKGPVGEQVVKLALTPEEVADEAFEKLGKEFSIITGERNKKSVHDGKANHTEDEYIRYMGSFYADQD